MMQIVEPLRRELRRIRRGQSRRFLRVILLAEMRRHTRIPEKLLEELERAGEGRVAAAWRDLQREIDDAAERLRREES